MTATRTSGTWALAARQARADFRPRVKPPAGQGSRAAAARRTSNLIRGKENVRIFGSLNEARTAAQQAAGLGDDAVDFVQQIGPHKGRVTSRMSPNGLRGWRIDFDSAKGFHVNWWDQTGGRKRADWCYGANIIEGGTRDDFLSVLEHFPQP